MHCSPAQTECHLVFSAYVMCCRNCIWNGLYYGSMHEIEVGFPSQVQLGAVRSRMPCKLAVSICANHEGIATL